ncbi:COP23 domain-containing protein [Anabaenopsis tanganyikae CS-531]|uniref:COP23 domain-containing protein n=1 Tax=Anabaenopsis tanganyikae CS-531 TaxID=2785304 RepID=A0ABT6KAZ8_9CYAN|nr:COP23 domain-containing protein [Anabaenopsis tanganyikae]MDH6104619.1 COP23 domain-containing protein [Anabaenopsis tanganyikae CS-531]
MPSQLHSPVMKKYLKVPLTALAVALSVSSVSVINSQPTAAQAQDFFCGTRWATNADVAYPATMARRHNGDFAIITWTENSRINDTWTPRKRCQSVSQRFEELNRQGKLQALAVGTVNNQPVICGLGLGERRCNSNNTLLTVTNGTDPGKFLDNLLNTRTSASGQPVLLNTNDRGRVAIPDEDSNRVVRVSIDDIINAHLSIPSSNSQPPQPQPQSERIW